MPKFTAPQARLASFSGKSGALCLFSLRAAHNFLREKKFTVAKKRSSAYYARARGGFLKCIYSPSQPSLRTSSTLLSRKVIKFRVCLAQRVESASAFFFSAACSERLSSFILTHSVKNISPAITPRRQNVLNIRDWPFITFSKLNTSAH